MAHHVTRRLPTVNHSQLWNTPVTRCGWQDSTQSSWIVKTRWWHLKVTRVWWQCSCNMFISDVFAYKLQQEAAKGSVFFSEVSESAWFTFSTERLFHVQLCDTSANHEWRFAVCQRIKKGRSCERASFCMSFCEQNECLSLEHERHWKVLQSN